MPPDSANQCSTPDERRPMAPFLLSDLQRAQVDEQVRGAIASFEGRMSGQMKAQHAELLETIKSGYPGGDPVGHRLYHEEMIEAAQARKKFYRELTLHLARGGVWALLCFLGYAAWVAFRTNLLGPD